MSFHISVAAGVQTGEGLEKASNPVGVEFLGPSCHLNCFKLDDGPIL